MSSAADSSSAGAEAPLDEGFATVSGPDASVTGVAAAAKRSGGVELLSQIITQEMSATREPMTEEIARQLFDMYLVDSDRESLTVHDVRQLLLDLLDAMQWPLVVPDESLDSVFSEMTLNDRGTISWVEFKSFCLFLHDRPLQKLFTLTTNGISREQLTTARLALFTLIDKKKSGDSAADDVVGGTEAAAAAAAESASSEMVSPPSLEATYDRTPYERSAMALVPNTDRVFVYFISAQAALVLCVSDRYTGPLLEPRRVQIDLHIGGEDSTMTQPFNVSIQAFDSARDVFPPTQRFGGFGSKVARRIADTYVAARVWDESHLKIGDKTREFARRASQTLAKIDADYKVTEQFNQATQSAAEAVSAFDEKHQISSTISATTKSIDEKYRVSERTDEALKKIQSNPTVKSVTTALSSWLSATRRSADQISSETRQLVTEKERERAAKSALGPADDSGMSAMSSAAADDKRSSDHAGLADVVAAADIVGDTAQAVPKGEDSEEDVD